MIIIKSLIFMNLFILSISFLIIMLERVISSYGECRIVINDDKEFIAQGGKSLLRVLFENRYFIPSACGGKGTCGYCKLKIKDGGAVLPTEALILSPKEIKEGYHLACQVKVRGDLSIEIPPEYLEIQEYKGELSYSELVTSDIKKIRIKLLGSDTIKYKPGQYVQIKFETDEGIDYRAYSMASNPDEHDEIELNVKKIPEGLGSGYLHTRKLGDAVEFSGPYGDFYLQTDSQHKIVCVAGGVGLAPLKSIIAFWKSHGGHRKLELYYGARNVRELYDHELFLKLAEDERFSYYPAISDEDPDWQGERGFIHTVLERNLREGESSEAYLCGPPIMIDAVRDVLIKKGISEERILYDKF